MTRKTQLATIGVVLLIVIATVGATVLFSRFYWFKRNEHVALWLEGIALVLIFFWDRIDARSAHKKTMEQIQIAKQQTDALVNAGRAWVIAELIPICAKFGNWWHRPAGNGWATLTEEEVLNGDHLRHKLKFTNMGRTPAHILRYQMGYSREVDQTDAALRMVDSVKRDEIEFDRLLAGNASVEAQDVDVSQYIRDSIVAIGDSAAAGILSGSVEYQHVFSDTEVVKTPFVYFYEPSKQGLFRVPLRKTEQDKKKQSPS
jgi:hypothetical protein